MCHRRGRTESRIDVDAAMDVPPPWTDGAARRGTEGRERHGGERAERHGGSERRSVSGTEGNGAEGERRRVLVGNYSGGFKKKKWSRVIRAGGSTWKIWVSKNQVRVQS
jgi:hypothetical protein